MPPKFQPKSRKVEDMKLETFGWRMFAASALLITAFAPHARPQGGKTSGSAVDQPPEKTITPKKTNSPAKTATKTTGGNSASAAKQSAAGTLASIDGKWWTSGNGFGDSEVVFSQNGSSVTGIISYADGRTGTVTGAMIGKRLQHSWTNSSGEGGSGWLELSWNNFLGGPWHNDKVRDGSWTLMRVEGKWCFGGSRTRIRTITHNARGELSMLTEDGSQEDGYLQGPWLFLESDGMTIKGTMDFRANRVDWSSGFFWTWCGRNQ
jgi:hypothetical protein